MTTKKRHGGKAGNFDIGYGKPPAKYRFKKGKSGNPKGRPKGAKGLRASMRKELQRMVTVKEGGVSKTMSKAEIIAKRAVNRAAENGRDALRLIEMEERLFGPEPPEQRPLDVDERALFERIKARLRRAITADATPAGDDEAEG